MMSSKLFRAAACVVVALALASAAPAPTIIPHPEVEGEAIIVPASSPVKFRGWDKSSGYAQFEGRFVLSGPFHYGCWSGCADYDGPVEEEHIDLRIEPDPAMRVRLPRWKKHKDDILIVLDGEEKLAQLVGSPRQQTGLRSGHVKSLQGRTAVVVDKFQTGIECDSATFVARFVTLVKAPSLARVEFNGDYGCV